MFQNAIQEMCSLVFIQFYFMTSISSLDLLVDFKQVNIKTNMTENSHPLILTPYITAGKIEEAQNLSKVHLKDLSDIESYSGFLTVNETCNSNMFFWFFPSERKNISDPVMLWLQGGPGVSSLYGLVEEIGPFYIENGTTLKKRQYHWNDKRNLLFIDNPVGAGFSFTNHVSECYSHNMDEVRHDLYRAMVQFYKLFPTLQKNDLFLFGESYAGKYLPALAYSIHENNHKSDIKINLKGLGIGNGLVDPVSMLNHSSLLYNFGLINKNGRDEIEILENEMIRLIKNEKWIDATKVYVYKMGLMTKMIPTVSIYNYLEFKKELENLTYFYNDDVKHTIHANNVLFRTLNSMVSFLMFGDHLKSVKLWVEELLEHYRIMFYSGQLDVIVGSVLTQNLIESLNWSGARNFRKQQQFAAATEGLMGFGTQYGNLYEFRIRNAGHMAPRDNPKALYLIMESFINNTTLKNSTISE